MKQFKIKENYLLLKRWWETINLTNYEKSFLNREIISYNQQLLRLNEKKLRIGAYGKSGVELLWAGSGASAANATIGFFSGRGFHDYFTAGNSIPNNATLVANTSPAGDILLSTKGFVSGDNYTLILEIR